jgi:mono/diheme cytochrome c family protein
VLAGDEQGGEHANRDIDRTRALRVQRSRWWSDQQGPTRWTAGRTAVGVGAAILRDDDAEPAPLSGAALLASRDGLRAYAINPDREILDVIDLTTHERSWQASVKGEPGHLVEDGDHRVHVVLRLAGAVATIDPITHDVVRRDVCPAPRGITVDGSDVWIACASGELVQMPTDPTVAGAQPSSVFVERDLRDIAVAGDGSLYLTTFRSAELLHVDRQGRVQSRARASDLPSGTAVYQPNVAWKMRRGPDGAIYMLHQLASNRLLGTVYYGSAQSGSLQGPLVAMALTRFVEGNIPNTQVLDGLPQPSVDFTIRNDGRLAFVSTDGMLHVLDPFAKSAFVQHVPLGFALPTAVVTGPHGWLVQTREPDALLEFDWNQEIASTTALSSTFHHKGFLIFHTPTTAGIACMSCHPEGGDDGRVWNFATGKMRTQSVRGGLLPTAPFHWEGDMPNIDQLAHDVFTTRMGGPILSPAQTSSLANFLDRIPPLPAPSSLDPDAVARGKKLFETKGGCPSCHAGAHFTTSINQDVGTGSRLQVPSLLGVGYRAPYMHDGCAKTLLERFTNPSCGGTKHGNGAALDVSERDDLIAYLGSL